MRRRTSVQTQEYTGYTEVTRYAVTYHEIRIGGPNPTPWVERTPATVIPPVVTRIGEKTSAVHTYSDMVDSFGRWCSPGKLAYPPRACRAFVSKCSIGLEPMYWFPDEEQDPPTVWYSGPYEYRDRRITTTTYEFMPTLATPEVIQFCELSKPFDALLPLYCDDLVQRHHARCMNMLETIEGGIGQAIFEFNETLSLAGDIFKFVRNPVRILSARYVWAKANKVRMRYARPGSAEFLVHYLSRDITSTALAYKYGVKPFIRDVMDIAKGLQNFGKHMQRYLNAVAGNATVVRTNAILDIPYSVFDPYGPGYEESIPSPTGSLGYPQCAAGWTQPDLQWTAWCHSWIKINKPARPEGPSFGINESPNSRCELTDPFVILLTLLGLNNPLKTLWDLTPYSFVAEWFLGLDRLLNYFDINNLLCPATVSRSSTHMKCVAQLNATSAFYINGPSDPEVTDLGLWTSRMYQRWPFIPNLWVSAQVPSTSNPFIMGALLYDQRFGSIWRRGATKAAQKIATRLARLRKVVARVGGGRKPLQSTIALTASDKESLSRMGNFDLSISDVLGRSSKHER